LLCQCAVVCAACAACAARFSQVFDLRRLRPEWSGRRSPTTRCP
jgi:hypothetical protein